MSDRTSVCLIILEDQVELAKSLRNVEECSDNWAYKRDNTYVREFRFSEVNYGELDCLEKLSDLGIAYDSEWDAGSEYAAGTQYCRFTSTGEINILSIYDSAKNPNLSELIKRIGNADELIDYILEFAKKVTPAPMDQKQIEYGLLYRTKQLIS